MTRSFARLKIAATGGQEAAQAERRSGPKCSIANHRIVDRTAAHAVNVLAARERRARPDAGQEQSRGRDGWKNASSRSTGRARWIRAAGPRGICV